MQLLVHVKMSPHTVYSGCIKSK